MNPDQMNPEELNNQVDDSGPEPGLSDTDIRFNCLTMAAQLPLETPKLIERAQAFYDFVTAKPKN